MNGVCYEYDCFAFAVEVILQSVVEDFLTYVGIESTEAVIDQVDVSVCVKSPSDRNTLLLPSREIDSLLPDLSLIPSRENLQIGFELADFNHTVVSSLVVLVLE